MTSAAEACRPRALLAPAQARAAVSAALLAALDTARWPDGSRLVDASDQAIQQMLVPALTDELIDRQALAVAAPSGIDTDEAT